MPINILPEQITALSEEAKAAEESGALTKRQLDIICGEGWFRMFLPKQLGGLNLDLPTGLRLEEALARIDGSLGWTVTLCSGATMFAGFMEPAVAEDLLSDKRACFGGSGAASGTADKRGDHYCINGLWKYATGAPHLTAFTANCKLLENGVPLLDSEGQPQIRAFVFKADEVCILNDWHTMGLRATAGHSFEVKDLFVPLDRAFDILPESARIDGPIFQYPFLPFAETTLAMNTSGMVLHFLDCCDEIFTQKAARNRSMASSHYLQMLSAARERCLAIRATFFEVADQSWKELCETGACSKPTQDAVSINSRGLVREARNVVQELFPFCGMAATDPEATINRIWRDLFTASQHSLLNKVD